MFSKCYGEAQNWIELSLTWEHLPIPGATTHMFKSRFMMWRSPVLAFQLYKNDLAQVPVYSVSRPPGSVSHIPSGSRHLLRVTSADWILTTGYTQISTVIWRLQCLSHSLRMCVHFSTLCISSPWKKQGEWIRQILFIISPVCCAALGRLINYVYL